MTFRLAVVAAALLVGCAAEETSVESASSEVVSVVRLDTVSPAEVQAEGDKRFAERLAVLVSNHPDMDVVTSQTLGTFVEYKIQHPGWIAAHVDHELADVIRGLFSFTEKSGLSISELKAAFPTWLAKQISAATTASGKVDCAAANKFGAICAAASDAKAFATAKKPTGADMGKFISEWKDIYGDASGSHVLRPVKLDGAPTVVEVKDIAGVISWCPERAWGPAAVDMYMDHHPELAEHQSALKGNGFKKRWYWTCGGNEWGASGFALLDEHNQLWAFTTYSSE